MAFLGVEVWQTGPMQPGPSASAVGSPRPAPMLARQRQEHILERVAATGGVRVADVVEELGISEMTVRRDITELVTQGLVERVHGGAVAAGPTTLEPRFTAKSTLNLEAKRRIGQAAAAMVRPGDSLALSAGTTTLALAQALTELEHFPTLTVITNSLPAAQVLFDTADAARAENRDAPTVVITGGERTPSNALVGLVAVDALRTMRVEWVFLGAHGFTPEAGLMTPNLQEASANQALVAAGRTVVATLDSSKWGVLGLRSFCATRDIGVLVTEAEPDADFVDALQQAGTRLTIAT